MLYQVYYDHCLDFVMLAFKTDDRNAVIEKAWSGLPKMVEYLG